MSIPNQTEPMHHAASGPLRSIDLLWLPFVPVPIRLVELYHGVMCGALAILGFAIGWGQIRSTIGSERSAITHVSFEAMRTPPSYPDVR